MKLDQDCQTTAAHVREHTVTLPDLLVAHLDLVFIGINPSVYSARQGHYFARPSNRFWPAFSKSRLSERARRSLGVEALRPEHDVELPRFGIGFTDLIKRPTCGAGELAAAEFAASVPRLVAKLQQYAPRVACFHGLMGYRPFARIAFGAVLRPSLGLQPESVGATRLWVVPNPSGANAHFTRAEQSAWYDRVAGFIASNEPESDPKLFK